MIAVIFIPEWKALPDLELLVVVPIAILAGLALGLIIGFATSSMRNGVIAGVGTLIALVAPPWLSVAGPNRTPLRKRRCRSARRSSR